MSTVHQKSSVQKKSPCITEDASGWVSDYPISSVMIVFGVGLGAGVALGNLLSEPLTARPTLGRRTELAAEQVGRQVLDALGGVLPASWAK